MSNHKRICFLLNPSANGGRAGRQEKKLKLTIEQHWPAAEWIHTEPDDLFWKKLKNRVDQFDLLVACGGDGTVHRAGNLAADANCELGIIPVGSGNDFAKMNNIPETLNKAVDLLKKYTIKEIDLIQCRGDIDCWCLNTIGFGLDGLANYYTNVYKKYIGKSGYLPGALQSAIISKPINIRMRIDDGEESAGSYIMLTACNGFREGGRFIVAPDAIIDDGRMNLLKVLPMNTLSLLIALPQFINSFPGNHERIETSTCKTFELQSNDPVNVHVDGEFIGGTIHKIRLEIKKRALRLLV